MFFGNRVSSIFFFSLQDPHQLTEPNPYFSALQTRFLSFVQPFSRKKFVHDEKKVNQITLNKTAVPAQRSNEVKTRARSGNTRERLKNAFIPDSTPTEKIHYTEILGQAHTNHRVVPYKSRAFKAQPTASTVLHRRLTTGVCYQNRASKTKEPSPKASFWERRQFKIYMRPFVTRT